MRHLLVTNDFPPKVGGIQSYLWELWRRLPSDEVVVMTPRRAGDVAWDARQGFRVVRMPQGWLLPTGALVDTVNGVARGFGADLAVLDPALPLGLAGSRLAVPYVVVVHGAEYVVPASLPGTRTLLRRVVRGAAGVIASGGYAQRAVDETAGLRPGVPVRTANLPPSADTSRFAPFDRARRLNVRHRYGLTDEHLVVLGVSRLVPRKGFDRLVIAAAELAGDIPNLRVLIAGTGRDSARLRRLIQRRAAPVALLGEVQDRDLPDLYGAADLFCMPCHDRWFGLEREGFGVVLMEAAAAGLPAVAGASGGTTEAVLDGTTGLLTSHAATTDEVTTALRALLQDASLRTRMGAAARRRTMETCSYDGAAQRLRDFLAESVRVG